MNKILVFLFIAILLFSSCSLEKKEISIPDYVITQDSMVHILADVHIQEAMMNQYSQEGRHMKMNPIKQYQLIFDKYNISKERYDSSYQFYLDNPSLLNKIYENVVIELTKKQAEIEQDKSINTNVTSKAES
ncbi:MAG: DUF4296 domain-containing protein [Bacteroidia bacterium]